MTGRTLSRTEFKSFVSLLAFSESPVHFKDIFNVVIHAPVINNIVQRATSEISSYAGFLTMEKC